MNTIFAPIASTTTVTSILERIETLLVDPAGNGTWRRIRRIAGGCATDSSVDARDDAEPHEILSGLLRHPPSIRDRDG